MGNEEALLRFHEIEKRLPFLLETLLACPPHHAGTKPSVPAKEGVYLFTEASKHLYVGRTGGLRLPPRGTEGDFNRFSTH